MDEESRNASSEATTSGGNSPAASGAHSGTGDINIDQSVHHLHPPSEALTFHGERLIGKSPEELLGYFETHTSIQAERLVEPFVGKPIRLGGVIQNIVAMPEGVLVLLMTSNQAIIQAHFALAWKDRLSEPNKGDSLDLMGRLGSLGPSGFSVTECELIGDSGPEKLPAAESE